MKLRGVSAALIVLAIAVILLGIVAGYLYYENTRYQVRIAELEGELSTVKNQLESAQSRINQLMDQASRLRSIVELRESEILYSGETINIPSASIFGGPQGVEYYVTADYAGYLELTLTATGNVTIRAIQENYNYYIEWNLQRGTIIIPVLPGQITIQFLNTDIFSARTVTFDLTYVY